MRPIDVVRRFAPNARAAYVAAFEAGDGLFQAHGITTPLRLAHFMAQVLHETDGLTIFEESLFYTHVEALRNAWSKRFAPMSDAQASAYLRNPKKLADFVYNGRMGNRVGSDDGFDYRGRGPMQTTGLEAYRRYGQKFGIDLVGHPELLLAPEHCLKPALAEWTEGNLNAAADRNDIEAITRRINGGLNGFESRQNWFRKLSPAISSVELRPGLFPVPPAPPPEPEPPVDLVDIAALQRRLNELKVDGTPITVDGIRGSRTIAALRTFQRSRGLDPDGILGPRTRAALDAAVPPVPKPVVPPAAQQGIGAAILAVLAGVVYWIGDHLWIVAVLVLAAAAGGALYWFRKKKG
jgi:putative chitinase